MRGPNARMPEWPDVARRGPKYRASVPPALPGCCCRATTRRSAADTAPQRRLTSHETTAASALAVNAWPECPNAGMARRGPTWPECPNRPTWPDVAQITADTVPPRRLTSYGSAAAPPPAAAPPLPLLRAA